ncbi:MAG: SDR family NAD(P)-dependent oxidoreductase [Desulfobacteraceae bacterium]|jgi:NAD(P)-dependent dehydrogenase (short-subunit alcohol dehydrogenase family)
MTDSPVIIVSGASRGLGAATARWLASIGAAVTLISRSAGALDGVAKEVQRLGGMPLVFKADISDAGACQAAVSKTLDRFGKLDALVNNAGIIEPIAPVASAEMDRWQYNIAVNLFGPFYLARAAIAELRKQKGRIVNVSSGAATLTVEHVSAYCAAKAALNHFTRVLAAEEPRLTVMTVRPGVVDTRMQGTLRRDGPAVMTAEQAAYYQNLKLRGELEAPEVPGRAIAWLTLQAPPEFSGQFLDYDDPRISGPALELFGEKLK